MKWLFRPRCPLEVREKVWIERGLTRIASLLGAGRVVTGTEVFETTTRFLDGTGEIADDPQALLSAVCGAMQFDRKLFVLRDSTPEDHAAPVPQAEWETDDDGRYVIRLTHPSAGGLELMTASLARIVGCAMLDRQGRFTPRNGQDLLLAELIPLTMGLGPCLANVTLAELQATTTGMLFRYGHLPSHMSGYALAVLCWLGGDDNPAYASLLRGDARAAYRHGLRYLHRTRDCLVQPSDLGRSVENRDLPVLLAELSSEFEGRRLAAVWELTRRNPDDVNAEAARRLGERLSDRNPVIRAEAAAALAKWASAARPAVPELQHAIRFDSSDEVCARAASAFGVICSSDQFPREERREVLDDLLALREGRRNQRVRDAAVEAMSRLGVDVEVIAPDLVKWIRDAIADGAEGRLRRLLECVRRVEPDVERFLREHFSDRDPELLSRAAAALEEPRTPAAYAGLAEVAAGTTLTNWQWI